MLWGTVETRVQAYVFLVKALGLYWLIWGVLELVYMFIDHTAWGWKLFIGVVSIIAGGSILMYLVAAALALPQIFLLVLGIWVLMEGVILLILALEGRWLGRRYSGRDLDRPGIHPDRQLRCSWGWPGHALGRSHLGVHRRLRPDLPGVSSAQGLRQAGRPQAKASDRDHGPRCEDASSAAAIASRASMA